MRTTWRLMILAGVILMLTGCLPKKYRLSFESPGFRTVKTLYAPGEAVEVSYRIATDTDYWFHIGDVEFEQDYDPRRGVILRFTMPEHDVTIGVDRKNTMTFDPDAHSQPDGISGTGGVPSGNGWICPECGEENSGKFCSECGHARPE